jgi:hypothetical protein
MIWGVLRQAEVCATSMIILAVRREDAAQMRVVKHDHVIEVFATD